MRWGVEYRQKNSDMLGLILFSADDVASATAYVDDMVFRYGFESVSNLKPLLNGACIDELRLLFPGYLPGKREEKE